MVIPKKFQIFGETYKVKELVRVHKDNRWGEHQPTGNVIKIKKGLNQEQKEQAYLHELVHCILSNLSYHELDDDEVFVDQFAKALHQILTSK
jgi:predicted transcriptional regulator